MHTHIHAHAFSMTFTCLAVLCTVYSVQSKRLSLMLALYVYRQNKTVETQPNQEQIHDLFSLRISSHSTICFFRLTRWKWKTHFSTTTQRQRIPDQWASDHPREIQPIRTLAFCNCVDDEFDSIDITLEMGSTVWRSIKSVQAVEKEKFILLYK